LLVNKPVLILSSSPAFTGGVRAQYQLREALTSMQARVVSGREIVIGGVSGKMKDGLFADEEVLRFIEDGVRRLRGEIQAGCDVAA
jgi:chromate reductase